MRVIFLLLIFPLFAGCTQEANDEPSSAEKMKTIREAIAEICRTDNDTPVFVTDRSTLQPILDQLNADLPQDLIEYLDHCIPTESYGRMVEFHGYETLIEENRDYVPGGDTIKQDLLCIAKEGDGSQFAYDVRTGKILHIGQTASETAEKTREEAWESWGSFIEFLNWYLHDLREVVAEQGA